MFRSPYSSHKPCRLNRAAADQSTEDGKVHGVMIDMMCSGTISVRLACVVG